MVLWLYDIAGSYQAGFDVATAKREGYTGGISKITEGLSSGASWDKINKSWSKRWHDQSVAEGMVWGGYHYLHKGNGAAQARYFLDEFNKITGRGVDGYLVQLDNEADADWQTTVDFSNEFYRQTHSHPYLMYTGSWWWNVDGRRWNGNSLTPYLWHSRYVAGTGLGSVLYRKVSDSFWTPGYGNWPKATILQYSAKGSVGGIVDNVDVNAFLGSTADLAKLTGGTNPMASLLETDVHVGNGLWRLDSIMGMKPESEGGQLKGERNELFYTLKRIEDKTGTLTLTPEVEQRIIDGVAAKVLEAINLPHTYEVRQTA